MIYKIYPPVGIARVGNSLAEFFIGPETADSPGLELQANGTETAVQRYKDASFRVKRQAARFRIFEFDSADSAGRPAQFPAGTTVRWNVKLANKKDAILREQTPQVEDPTNPVVPKLPQLDLTRANRAIAAEGSPPTHGTPAAKLTGTYLTGTLRETKVLLGELLIDKDGNLIVLGGHGVSESPEGKPIGNEVIGGEAGGGFYNNRGWFDDVSDGPVSAEITLPGAPSVKAAPAWVVVAPPDFAPATGAVVTLYDIMLQAALDRQEVTLPIQPSFSQDIWPMLRRAAGLFWVNRRFGTSAPPYWAGFSTDWVALAKNSDDSMALRQDQAKLLREIRSRNALRNFLLRPWQLSYLEAWERGQFLSDFNGAIPGAGVLSPEGLARSALDATAGQGFFPGIEAGIIVTNKTIYSEPFRIAAHVMAGDLTARMALPWQADFLECAGNWWPSQRPDTATPAEDPNGLERWLRPIDPDDGHRDLAVHFGKLGVIVPRTVNGNNVFVEVDRDENGLAHLT
jgi:hypothetical protein